MKSLENVKRCFFLTDSHLGIRNSSNEWIDIHQDYFYNFFIPLVKEQYRPGDILIHLGDVFDSRQSINLKVLNLGLDIFKELSSIFVDGIIIICGNHDVYMKNTNDINSLKPLALIPNITILEEPELYKIDKKKFLFMPWRKDHEAEQECMTKYKGKAEYLICHADIKGLKFNSSTDVLDGCEMSEYQKFKKVYAGHIHYSQQVNNVYMLGSPYQLTRSDSNNPKGIVLLDIESGNETYFENNYSPKFIKLKFGDILQMTPLQVEALIKNNFVDILLDFSMVLKSPVNTLLDLISGYRRIDFHVVYQDDKSYDKILNMEGKTFNLIEFVKEYVNNKLPYDANMKEKIFKSIVTLHNIAENQNTAKE